MFLTNIKFDKRITRCYFNTKQMKGSRHSGVNGRKKSSGTID
jgi:hypothetical protein